MKSTSKLQTTVLVLSLPAVIALFAYFSFAVPFWISSSNAITPAVYNPLANYSFAINWTDANNATSNVTFQLGSPSGGMANYTGNTTGYI